MGRQRRQPRTKDFGKKKKSPGDFARLGGFEKRPKWLTRRVSPEPEQNAQREKGGLEEKKKYYQMTHSLPV